MARTTERSVRQRKVLFARVGWMLYYRGRIPGDDRPIGGGRYNKSKIGHEVYNFQEAGEHLYGYFQPTMSSNAIALERIDPEAAGEDTLNSVLVVFIARRPKGRQVIVGWYKDAKVFRRKVQHSPGKPRGYGHFCSAEKRNCTLIYHADRDHEIPFGKGSIGQSNVWYPLAGDGSQKRAPWIQQALDFIVDYQGSNIFAEPEVAVEKESAAAAEEAFAQSKGQGFARTPEERQALEDRAMAVAKKYFRDEGFGVENVSARRPYDLLCRRGTRELHVEVKGTTTDGVAIVLTNNEVKHACDPRNSCVLFILHSIRLEGQKATGGRQLILNPWRLQQARLTPINYTYRL